MSVNEFDIRRIIGSIIDSKDVFLIMENKEYVLLNKKWFTTKPLFGFRNVKYMDYSKKAISLMTYIHQKFKKRIIKLRAEKIISNFNTAVPFGIVKYYSETLKSSVIMNFAIFKNNIDKPEIMFLQRRNKTFDKINLNSSDLKNIEYMMIF